MFPNLRSGKGRAADKASSGLQALLMLTFNSAGRLSPSMGRREQGLAAGVVPGGASLPGPC